MTARDCCAAVRGSECHCARCHQTFSGLGQFDAHQDVDYTRREPVVCKPPWELGLAQSPRGTWCTPEGLKARERSATALARARSARAQETP